MPVAADEPEDMPAFYARQISAAELKIYAKEAEIKKKTDTSLTIELPEIVPGTYDLTLKTISGQVTLQDAIRVRKDTPFLTPEALAQIAAWTKINASKTKVRLVAKNPVSLGKLQFKLNGKEVAWINAIDGSDPKLRVISGTSYFNRVLTLPRGKNAIEIYLNGQ